MQISYISYRFNFKKKIFLFIFITFFLGGCLVNSNIKNEKEMKGSKNVGEKIYKVEYEIDEKKGKLKKKIFFMSGTNLDKLEKLIKEEKDKFDFIKKKIETNESGFDLLNLNCSLFKTLVVRTECEEYKLKEIAKNCGKKFLGHRQEEIDKIFSKKNFPDLVDNEIEFYKKICNENIKISIKEKKMFEDEKKIEKRLRFFKPSDCVKLADDLAKVIGSMFTKEDKNRFIYRCKIGVALKYKNGCDLLKDKELKQKCFKIKKDLEYYRYLKFIDKNYGNFNLYPFLKAAMGKSLTYEENNEILNIIYPSDR